MRRPLEQLGNIPVTASAIESLFPYLKKGNQKLRSLEREGSILRLKKGLYVCSSEESGKELSIELISNHLYAPSYVSMSSALRYYGLIPEAVYTCQSMTLKRAKHFSTPVGEFDYAHIAKESFHIGVTIIRDSSISFLMATPEKALCDLIACSPSVNLRYVKEAEIYLAEDIRMEIEDFMQMDAEIFEKYTVAGKKASSVRTLLKLLRR